MRVRKGGRGGRWRGGARGLSPWLNPGARARLIGSEYDAASESVFPKAPVVNTGCTSSRYPSSPNCVCGLLALCLASLWRFYVPARRPLRGALRRRVPTSALSSLGSAGAGCSPRSVPRRDPAAPELSVLSVAPWACARPLVLNTPVLWDVVTAK